MMNLFRRFRERHDGVLAIEFAFIAPILILVIYSLIEVTDAVAAKRRLYLSVGIVGDLITTYDTSRIDEEDVQNILTVGQQTLQPYGIDTAVTRVTAVTWDGTKPVVVWSRFREADGTIYDPADDPNAEDLVGYIEGNEFPGLDDKYVLEDDEEMVGDYHVIVVDTSYTFTSAISARYIPELPMYVREIRVPRYVPKVHLCSFERTEVGGLDVAGPETCTSDPV